MEVKWTGIIYQQVEMIKLSSCKKLVRYPKQHDSWFDQRSVGTSWQCWVTNSSQRPSVVWTRILPILSVAAISYRQNLLLSILFLHLKSSHKSWSITLLTEIFTNAFLVNDSPMSSSVTRLSTWPLFKTIVIFQNKMSEIINKISSLEVCLYSMSSISHTKTNLTKTTRSTNAHDWRYNWGCQT